MIISIIAALAQNRVIGKDNGLPWKLPDDMHYFMRVTTHHHVIMGRKSYESLPSKYRPLPLRTNLVLTHQPTFEASDCFVVRSLEDAFRLARERHEKEVFVIGGAHVYQQALPLAHRLYLTEIHASVQGTTHFPEIDKEAWKEVSRTNHPHDEKHVFAFDFVRYERL